MICFLIVLNVTALALFVFAAILFYRAMCFKSPKYDTLKITYKGITEKPEEIVRNVIYYTIENEDLVIITDEGFLMIEFDSISSLVSIDE